MHGLQSNRTSTKPNSTWLWHQVLQLKAAAERNTFGVPVGPGAFKSVERLGGNWK